MGLSKLQYRIICFTSLVAMLLHRDSRRLLILMAVILIIIYAVHRTISLIKSNQ